MITERIPKDKFLLIAGPCAIEGKEISFEIAERLISITNKLSLPIILVKILLYGL